jgi:hypothetical protein
MELRCAVAVAEQDIHVASNGPTSTAVVPTRRSQELYDWYARIFFPYIAGAVMLFFRSWNPQMVNWLVGGVVHASFGINSYLDFLSLARPMKRTYLLIGLQFVFMFVWSRLSN